MEVFIIILFLTALTWAVIYSYKNNKKFKEAGGISILPAKHVEGIPLLMGGQLVGLRLYNDRITINDQQSLPLSRIRNINVKEENEISEKERSIIGRSVVGGLLLGPLGAVVGGMTGVKNKKVTKSKHFVIIDFTNKDSEQSTAIFVSEDKYSARLFVASTLSQIKKVSPNMVTAEL